MKKEKIAANLMAGLTIFIWGITFISTKQLLQLLTPEEIVVFRFGVAFLILQTVTPKKMVVSTIKEEVIFALLGLTGIALYFWIENLALKYTYASNVGLISSAIPIFTALLAHYITKEEKFTINFIIGFIVAIIGIFMIIYNGRVLKLNPIGDLLAVVTAILFSIYSVLLKFIKGSYSQLYIAKKIFFYGIIFIFPIGVANNVRFSNIEKLNFYTAGNLLFLSIFASVLCFIMWNKAVKIIGSVKASNYIYFVPLITMASSAVFLKEKINGVMIIGGILIFSGVYINNRSVKIERAEE